MDKLDFVVTRFRHRWSFRGVGKCEHGGLQMPVNTFIFLPGQIAGMAGMAGMAGGPSLPHLRMALTSHSGDPTRRTAPPILSVFYSTVTCLFSLSNYNS